MKQNIIDKKAQNIRRSIIELSYKTNSPHLGSSLSCVEILISILKNFKIKKDELIFSKGHAALAYYSALYEFSYLTKKELDKFLMNGTKLWSHITKQKKNSFFKFSFGSLGYGLGISAGIAYLKKNKKKNSKIFCVLSDGELNEGSTWESLLFISHHKLNNLNIFIDKNNWQSFGKTKDIINLDPLNIKLKTFDYDVYQINGHSVKKIDDIINSKSKFPKILICNTIKGKGLKRVENTLGSHYFPAKKKDIL